MWYVYTLSLLLAHLIVTLHMSTVPSKKRHRADDNSVDEDNDGATGDSRYYSLYFRSPNSESSLVV